MASTYLGVTAVSVLMGTVHPPTGIAVQVVMTLAVIIGLILYHRRPHLQQKLLAMGLPEKLAVEWEGTFQEGFALALEKIFETARGVDSNTMSLQYLETLKAIGAGGSSKFLIPVELTTLLRPFAEHATRSGDGAVQPGAPAAH